MSQRLWTQVESNSIIIISLSVLYCFQRNRNSHLHKHIHTHTHNPPDTQVNQRLPPSQTANQPVTRQTAQAPSKENMLFFWASLNFTAYKTQPHGAHPTHGEIKALLSHWKPIVTHQRPRTLRSGFASMRPQFQAHWFLSFPTQTSTHSQAFPAMLLLLIIYSKKAQRGVA